MRGVELFSGTGTVSRVFREGGWEMEEVDILQGKDVLTWQPTGNYDFVWASPPCQQYSAFSPAARASKYQSIWNADPTLWLRSLELIRKIAPRYWVIENVKMAQWVWGRATYHYGSYYLWGYFPVLPPRPDMWKQTLKGTHWVADQDGSKHQEMDSRGAAERARIPEELAKMVFRAVNRGVKK